MVAQPLAGGQCWQAKVHTFLMIGDPHCSFLSAWGSSPLLPLCCVFNMWGAICIYHLLHIHCRPFMFIFIHHLLCLLVPSTWPRRWWEIFICLWIVKVLVNWQGGVTYWGTSSLSSWVHPSIRVIVVGFLSLLNLYRGCQIHVIIIIKSMSSSSLNLHHGGCWIPSLSSKLYCGCWSTFSLLTLYHGCWSASLLNLHCGCWSASSLSKPDCGCQICLIVIKTTLWLSNPCRCHQIHVVVVNPHPGHQNHIMVVEPMSSSSNPHHGGQSMLSSSNLHHGCQIHLIIIETTSWLSNPCCCHQNCIMVVKSMSLSSNLHHGGQSTSSSLNLHHHCQIHLIVVETASWLSNPHHHRQIHIIFVESVSSLWSNPSSIFRCVCWSFVEVGVCWEWVRNWSERSGKVIMGNKNTPCLCDSPSQSSLSTNPAQILVQKLKNVGPCPSARGGARVGYALVFMAGSRWLKITCRIHPSLEGKGDVAVSSGVGDLKRTNEVSIQWERTEGRGGGNDGIKGRERHEKVQSTWVILHRKFQLQACFGQNQ